ncbi:CatA-like O-acetyltransferase [Bengtsoniella intestinalis]|uniref:CatA-like O-acetyltransferase n=1 Tax=Bengtsoniella intestinalis TaxID=3073143 RepID=UPI00391FC452
MSFELIDFENWERKEFYHHFSTQVVCYYSLTVNIDVTPLKDERLYPAMLFLLTNAVNETKEFRTSLSVDGVGYFTEMHPSYTIFNKQNKNFSVIWTEYNTNYNSFLQSYLHDVSCYKDSVVLAPKEGKPENTFDVSMLPWTTFSAFNINVQNAGIYLLPIFTMGKTFIEQGKTMLPLAIQIHHAACDGYHVGMFINGLQEKINRWDK